jgi:short-subunit dehydrogenase
MTQRPLLQKNIVITGASSGIGRATALVLAQAGANIIVSARRLLLLEEVAKECSKYDVKALAFKADVTRLDDLRSLYEFALKELGQIDIWINNAGVGAVGEFTKTPIEVHEQVIKTNLMGQLYGAYVIVPYFKDQQKGILINNISIGAFVPTPYAVAYSASKFGLKGYAEALRYELLDYKDIHVCDIFPAFIDTPGFIHGANFSGSEISPGKPIYDPYKVANTILSLCLNPKDRIMVGNSGKIARLLHALTPKLMGNLLAHFVQSYGKGAAPRAFTTGNLFRPMWRGAGTHGGFKLFNLQKKLKG